MGVPSDFYGRLWGDAAVERAKERRRLKGRLGRGKDDLVAFAMWSRLTEHHVGYSHLSHVF